MVKFTSPYRDWADQIRKLVVSSFNWKPSIVFLFTFECLVLVIVLMIDSNENWAINFRFESNEMDSVCWCLVYTFRMMCICCRKKKLFTVCYRLRIYAGTKAVCDDTNAINMKTQHRGEMWDISKTHRIFVEFVVSVSSCLVFPFHKRWFAIHKLISIFLFQSILHSFDKGNEMKPIKLKKKNRNDQYLYRLATKTVLQNARNLCGILAFRIEYWA